jgi:hypothetical protein
LTITNSTISNNFAIDSEPPGFGTGGGIDAEGTLTITESTISGNHSGYVGGGVAGYGTITDSTISENTAGGSSESAKYSWLRRRYLRRWRDYQ